MSSSPNRVIVVIVGGAPTATIKVDEAPWFVEHTSVERGAGECGGMEETIHPRVRYASDGGAMFKELSAIDSSCPHGSSTGVAEHHAFDFDGDGITELMVVTETVGAQGVSSSWSNIWTLRGGAIVPYSKRDAAAAISFASRMSITTGGRISFRGSTTT